MSEQEFAVPERRRGSKLLLVIVLAAVVIGAGAYYVMATMRAARWDAADYLPEDTVAAVVLDLRPTREKSEARDHILDICKNAGLEDPEGKLMETISSVLELDFEKDVVKHLNQRAAVAVTSEMHGFEPGAVGVVGAKSNGAARQLMAVITRKLAEDKIDFERRRYRNFTYIRIPDSSKPDQSTALHIGVVGNAIVISNGESGFKKVVRTVEGEPSLVDDEHFARLRQADGSSVATIYWSGVKLFQMIEPFFEILAMQQPELAESYKQALQNQLAAVGTAGVSGKGIEFTVRGITEEPSEGPESTAVAELVSAAPEDAALVAATGSLAKFWELAKKELEKDPETRKQLDEIFGRIFGQVGIDLFEDVFFPIKTLAIYYAPGPARDPSEFPGRITLLAKLDNPDAFRSTLDRIKPLIGSLPNLKLAEVDLNGEKTALLEMGSAANGFDVPGGALQDSTGGKSSLYETIVQDTLILTMTGPDGKRQAESAVAALKGTEGSVSTTDSFKFVQKHLPRKTQMLFYCDAAAVAQIFAEYLERDERKILDAILNGTGTIAAFGNQNGKEYEMSVVLPFRD